MTLYLDYAASTPVAPEVAAAMADALADPALQANPSATHAPGRAARACVERARMAVAGLIAAHGDEIVWTSGATEANNLAVIGAARFRAARGRHLVTGATEHPSVLEAFRRLEHDGFTVTYVAPNADGVVTPDAVAGALRSDTTLVSLMQVNNETGVVQDVAAVGEICRRQGVILHVDAAQAAGRVAVDVRAQGIAMLSLSAHKMYGPKGVGALFLDAGRMRRVEPLLHGGGQERGLRPGTVPVHQVVGMGVAAGLAAAGLATEPAALAALRDQLWDRLRRLPGVLRNGTAPHCACHIVNVSVVGVEGESLLHALRDIAVSSGSACASEHAEPSAVLRLLGRPDHLAQSSIRFSIGRGTTANDIDVAATAFAAAVRHLRRLSPAVVA